tara:strand:+ start:101 stop:286 length:186 start_codon:yes stop_codon:yes gene_type:complete
MAELIKNESITDLKTDIANFLSTLKSFGIDNEIKDFIESSVTEIDLIDKTLRETKIENFKL